MNIAIVKRYGFESCERLSCLAWWTEMRVEKYNNDAFG